MTEAKQAKRILYTQYQNNKASTYLLKTQKLTWSPNKLLQPDTLVKNCNDRLQCYAASSLLRHLPIQHVRKFTADHDVRERV